MAIVPYQPGGQAAGSPACRRSATRYGGADGPRIAQKAARYWRSYPAVTARQRPNRRQGEA